MRKAIAIGVLAALLCYLRLDRSWAWDMSWPLVGARLLATGHNPYIDPNDYAFLISDSQYWPQFYPVSAFIAVAPFAIFPLRLGGALLFGCFSALLAYGSLREPWRLLIFLSYPYWQAMTYVQWSPLMAACALLPNLAALTLCKPSIGMPVLLAYPPKSKRAWIAVGAAFAFLLLSVLLGWLTNVRSQPDSYIPLLSVPGVLLTLSLLRWRDPRARLLFLTACVPQRAPYDLCALGVIPSSRWQMPAWVAISWFLPVIGPYLVALICLFLPARLPASSDVESAPV